MQMQNESLKKSKLVEIRNPDFCDTAGHAHLLWKYNALVLTNQGTDISLSLF